MENNAIMNNEVIETTEEVIENTGMSKGIKIAAGIGLNVIVGFVVYTDDCEYQNPDRAEKDGCREKDNHC